MQARPESIPCDLRIISKECVTQRGKAERSQGTGYLIPAFHDVGLHRIDAAWDAVPQRLRDRLGDRAGRLVVTDSPQRYVARRQASCSAADVGYRGDIAHPHRAGRLQHPLPLQAVPDTGLDRWALSGGKDIVRY